MLVRDIRPADKRRLALAHAHLSAESQRRRFLAPKPRLSRSDLRYLTEVDGHDHVALVAVLASDPRIIVGVGRCVRLREDPASAEFAIAVGDALQGRGLGSRLAELLARRAVAEGVTRFTAVTESDNLAVQRIIARIGEHLAYERSGGLREIVAELAA